MLATSGRIYGEEWMNLDKDEIAWLTEQHGGTWGINHTRRLLHLVEEIGKGLTYNAEAIWIAAHLHDWGAYAPWAQKGVDHVERSDRWLGLLRRETSEDWKASS
jgi:HD superfamily phosphodiesterase